MYEPCELCGSRSFELPNRQGLCSSCAALLKRAKLEEELDDYIYSLEPPEDYGGNHKD